MSWALWALLLLLQNASHTWVSRARNSKSLRYHAAAAVCSNGLWILSLGLAVNKLADAEGAFDYVLACVFYTFFTVSGSVAAHHLLMTHVERGDRKATS